MAKANVKNNENLNENVNMNENENVNENEKNTNIGGEKQKETSAAPVEEVKKVKVIIPTDPINDEETFVPVVINGYIYQIKRGEEVEVPKEVARILKEAGYIS